jgi:hypothetical protein
MESNDAGSDSESDPAAIYELSRDALALQLQAADGLDAKVATLMAVGSALLGVMAAVLVVRPQSHETTTALTIVVGVPWDYCPLSLHTPIR